VALAALVLAIAGAAALSSAAAADSKLQPSLDRMVRYLQESQRPSGGFASPGKKPSQSISAWVALALAAAGINPQDQATCGVDAFAFLERHFREGLDEELAWPQAATTAFERELLVVDAAGTDPHEFAGTDLVAEILGRQLPDGSFPFVPGGRGEVNDTVFAVLALSPVDEPAAQRAVEEGAEWLLTQQNEDGGWSWQVKGSPSEVDLTGGVIEALNAAGEQGGEAEERAFEYLHEVQRPDGGFAEYPGESESNVASTAWGVQGIWAAGENPETWRTGSGEASEEPLDYLESMQQPDGHARWKKSSDLNGIWMTAYVAPAFAGQALPVPAASRAFPTAPASAAAAQAAELPASCLEPAPKAGSPAPGAESPRPGGGVLAGGGGGGADLFSRPKPQSQGGTPGGARVVHSENPHPTNRSRTRRGANSVQPAGTESAEATGASAREAEPSAVSGGSGTPDSGGGGEDGAGPRVPAAFAKAARAQPGDARSEVSGTLIGSTGGRGGKLAFGAPGLRSAGSGDGGETLVAIGIGVAALLAILGGARWELRRQEVVF
jgi:prenyltransferase beta subunit